MLGDNMHVRQTMRSPMAQKFNFEEELAHYQRQEFNGQQVMNGFPMPLKQPFNFGMPEQDMIAPLSLKNQFDSDFSRPYNLVPAHSEIKCIRDPVSHLQKENNSALVPQSRKMNSPARSDLLPSFGNNKLGLSFADEKEPSIANPQNEQSRMTSRVHTLVTNKAQGCVREIDTKAYRPESEVAEMHQFGRLPQKATSRIEIVQWEDSESSCDQNSDSCNQVTLQQLMMGANGGSGAADEKLTIDNLWKILASEKVSGALDNQATRGGAASRKQANAPYEKDTSNAVAQPQYSQGLRQKFGTAVFENCNYGRPGASKDHHTATQSSISSVASYTSPAGDYAAPGRRESSRTQHQYLTPQEIFTQSHSRGQVSPIRFSRENGQQSYGQKSNYEQENVHGIFNTPSRVASEVRDRNSTQMATPESYQGAHMAQGIEKEGSRLHEFDFAAKQSEDQIMRYKSRFNSDLSPDAVDNEDKSLSIQSSRSALNTIIGLNSSVCQEYESLECKSSMSAINNLNKTKATSPETASLADLFLDDEEEDSESIRYSKQTSSRAAYGLRKISRQVINTIRASKNPVTYKEVSELMTRKNLPQILAETDKRSPDMTHESAVSKGRLYVSNLDNNFTEAQAKAIQNYQRRIYDSWSVLRATNVIERASGKSFRYNSRVLEGAADEDNTISADKLRRILQSVNSMESNRINMKVPVASESGRWNEDHAEVMDVINTTEQQCGEAYGRIKARLSEIRNLSQSNLALRRLVKRNQKREGQIAQYLGARNSKNDQIYHEATNKVCKMPFVVADYTPDQNAVLGSGRTLGIRHRGNNVTLASKRPIRAFDDVECLNQLDLSDSDSESGLSVTPSASQISAISRRENESVSRSFYSNSRYSSASKQPRMVDARIIELLQRLPKDKRIAIGR